MRVDAVAPTTGHTPLMDALWYKYPALVGLLRPGGRPGPHYPLWVLPLDHLDYELNVTLPRQGPAGRRRRNGAATTAAPPASADEQRLMAAVVAKEHRAGAGPCWPPAPRWTSASRSSTASTTSTPR